MMNRLRFLDRKEYTGRKGGLNELDSRIFFLNLAHVPYGLNLGEMARIVGTDAFLRRNLVYRFRAKKQIAPISYALNTMANRHGYRKVEGDWDYISPAVRSAGKLEKIIERLHRKKEIKMVCVQSLNEFDRPLQARIKTMLHDFLSNGSPG